MDNSLVLIQCHCLKSLDKITSERKSREVWAMECFLSVCQFNIETEARDN